MIGVFGYSDCPGQAAAYPLALLSGQPETRLHSQQDNGAASKAAKIQGREPVLIHPADADARGITDGEVVELFNGQGRCLAGARVTDDVAEGCLFLWNGAWYDPDFAHPQQRDRHGNPNVLTRDLRSSRLSQGPAAHSAFVEIARFDGNLPPVGVHEPPAFFSGDARDNRGELGHNGETAAR